MAGNIKGITVEFRGDTTKLDSALKKVKSESKGVDKELREVNKLLKFNPKDTTLLAQKQTLLKEKVAQTTRQLQSLKSMQSNMNAQGVDKNSEAYRKLEREIVESESKLRHFNGELTKVAAQNSKIGQLGTKFSEVGGKMTAVGNAMRGISMAAAGVVAGLGAITYKAGVQADDLNTLSKQYGINTKDLQIYSRAADLVDVEVGDLTRAHVKLKRNMGTAMKGTGDAAEAFKSLGINITDSNGNMRDGNQVFDETIAALGKMENETQRDALALQIFGKSAAMLNPLIEDGGETYRQVAEMMNKHGLSPISQAELDKANKFNDQIDTIKFIWQQAIQIIGTKLAGFLLPAITKIQEGLSWVAERVAKLPASFFAIVGGVSSIVAVMAPALIVFGKFATLIGGALSNLALMIKKVPVLGKALMFLKANPIVLIITALITLGLLLNKTGMSASEMSKKIESGVGKMTKVVTNVIGGIVKVLPQIITSLVQALVTAMPMVIKGLQTLIQAVVKALPQILQQVLPVLVKGITMIINMLARMLPQLIQQLLPVIIQGIVSIINMLPQIIPQLVTAITNIITQVANMLPTLIPMLLKAAVTLFMALVKAIPQILQALAKALPQILSAVLSFLKSMATSVWAQIKTMVSGIMSRLGFTGLVDKIKGVFGKVKDAIWQPIKSARDKVKEWVDKIKEFFPFNIGKILKLKIPKIKIKGGKAPWGIGGAGKKPSIDIEWHKQGGIFTRPTLLQGANGSLHGVGEAGAEAILPLSTLNGMLQNMADSIVNGVVASQSMAVAGEPIVVNLYAYPNGQKLDEAIVTAYNRGSRRLGK